LFYEIVQLLKENRVMDFFEKIFFEELNLENTLLDQETILFGFDWY
jgi:hypothetical protein